MSNYKQGGWDEKYTIHHKDGTPVSEGKVRFVLNLTTDPHARVAMEAYAQSVSSDNPQLAADIDQTLFMLNEEVECEACGRRMPFADAVPAHGPEDSAYVCRGECLSGEEVSG